MNSTWRDVIQAVAPGLAGILGGPLAGVAVKALSTAILGKADGTEAEVEQAVLSGGSDVLARIKEADAKLQSDLAAAGVKLEEISASDRASARIRETTSQDNTTKILAVAYTVAYFGCLWAVWKFGIPSESKDLLQTLLGVLTAAQATIMNYYFGSSAGSAQKTNLLADK
jgi:hypothetical protein